MEYKDARLNKICLEESANFHVTCSNMDRKEIEGKGIKVFFVWRIGLHQPSSVEIKERAGFLGWQWVNELVRDTGAVCSAAEWSSSGRPCTQIYSLSLSHWHVYQGQISVISTFDEPLMNPGAGQSLCRRENTWDLLQRRRQTALHLSFWMYLKGLHGQ